MKKNIHIFSLFTLYSFKTILQQPVSMVFFIVGKAVRFFLMFFFLFFLLSKTKALANYTLNETLVFFLTFNFIDNMSQLLFREVYRFKPLVITGELDAILIKPYHPFFRILTGGVDLMDSILIIPYIFLLVFFLATLHASFAQLALYIILVINGLTIATAFHIAVLALAVVTTEIDNAITMYRDLIRLAMVPVDIYTEPVRSIITFVIPIGIMVTVPVKALLNQSSWELIIMSIVISSLCLATALWAWEKAMEKYQSWGG